MIPKLQGSFYGCELDPAQADIATIQHIQPKLLKQEPELMRKKSFDYRRMHPTVATYLFVAEYIKAFKRMTAAAFDVDRAQFVKGMKEIDFMDSRERNTFWKLRQKADECGVRYDFFMRSAMQWCLARGWHQPPRPSQIYSNDDMIVAILDAWAMECRAKIQYPEDPHFLVENWVGSVDQLAYEAYLVERIKQKPTPKYALNAAIYEMGVLRIEAALEHFPVATVEAATDYCLQVQSY